MCAQHGWNLMDESLATCLILLDKLNSLDIVSDILFLDHLGKLISFLIHL